MVRPFDGIRAFHNAFRNDMVRIDTAALEGARGTESTDGDLERYRFFNEILVWHASGEETAIYPPLEAVAPLVAEAYVMDHRGLDQAFDALDHAHVRGDTLETARAAAAFRFHLDLHLYKEDAHLYRVFDERIPLQEQWTALGGLAASIPQHRFPEVVRWLFPLIGPADRENMVRIFQRNLPAEALPGVMGVIYTAIGDDWADLARRVPEIQAR